MMVRLLLIALIAASALLPAPAAQQRHPDKPLLWKIEGKRITTPSYLFGSIHLGDPAILKLHPAAQKAFDEAASLHTEIPMDLATQLRAARLFLRQDNSTLSASIGPDLSKRLDKQLAKINPALTTAGFDQMRTWMPAISLYSLKDQMAGRKALDLTLWERASAAGKVTQGLETPEGQIGQLNKLNEKEQVVLIEASLNEIEGAGDKDPMEPLRQAYLEGNADKIEKIVLESIQPDENIPQSLVDKFNRLLFTERNAVMTTSIQKQLESQPDKSHFFVAGAGHYVGPDSVVELLKKAGYTITRITE